MVRPVIKSTKHYVQIPFSDIGTGVIENVVLVDAVQIANVNTSSEVDEGSIIKAVFIEMWVQNSGVDGTFIMTIVKQPEFGSGPTFVENAALMNYSNKKNVLYTTMGLTPNDGVSGPINISRQYFKIPKGKQRFGLGDRLVLSISNTSAGDLHRCGFATFKEYS